MNDEHGTLHIGWATADLTPDEPVFLAGQMHARVSEGVRSPITATVMAIESSGCDRLVMVSCDLVHIPNALRDAVRERLRDELPELAPESLLLNATHTHTAPKVETRGQDRYLDFGITSDDHGVDLHAMTIADFLALASGRIADAVARAWQARRPAAIGFGLGQAVIGTNRLVGYRDGGSRMYGAVDDEDFSHLEGGADHGLRVLASFDEHDELSGLVLNLACPSQVVENTFEISADFWHDTREELRRRFGHAVPVLAQCAPAGDQSPRPHSPSRRAEERMQALAGRDRCAEIAVRIADAVESVLPLCRRDLRRNAELHHEATTLMLPRRMIGEDDLRQAEAQADELRQRYEQLLSELEAEPQRRREPRWYRAITAVYGKMLWNRQVAKRYRQQHEQAEIPVEVHAARLGEVAFASNPFELYLDFGLQIQARSDAEQTFLVQLAGAGTYLPTARAIAGGAYGAVPASTVVGPEAGDSLVAWSVDAILRLGSRAGTPQAQTSSET